MKFSMTGQEEIPFNTGDCLNLRILTLQDISAILLKLALNTNQTINQNNTWQNESDT
jgi:hypothetical protein